MPLYPPVESGWMQYTNSANNSTTALSPAFAELTIDTDFDSLPDSLFTKISSTRIRTNFDGYVRVSFKVEIQTNTNDRPGRAVVVKNGSQLANTSARNLGKTNANRYHSVSGSFIIPCVVNDEFSLGFGNAESADTATVFAGQGVFTVQFVSRGF
jgi:hypothetical protein